MSERDYQLVKQVLAEAEEDARIERVLLEKVQPALDQEKIDPNFWSEAMSASEFKKMLQEEFGAE